MRPAAGLATRLGLAVRDLDLLEQALVHSSYLHEHPDAARAHNERLEYLGDAVVNLAISEALFSRHPHDDEGTLSARRAAIVSTVGLARLAGRLGLGEWLLLGEGESQRGGRLRPSLLASAFEAVAGAIYLDQGYTTTRDWLLALAAPEISADHPIGVLKSPKSRLQEYTQRRTGSRPVYRILEATGPDHEKLFRIEAVVEGTVVGVGEGSSRRVAETAAAAAALETLRQAGHHDAPHTVEPADGPDGIDAPAAPRDPDAGGEPAQGAEQATGDPATTGRRAGGDALASEGGVDPAMRRGAGDRRS